MQTEELARIGSATNERSGAMLFSIDGPVIIAAAMSAGSRRCSSRPGWQFKCNILSSRQKHCSS